MQLASIMVKCSHANEYRDQVGRVAKGGAQLPRAGEGSADLGRGHTFNRTQGPGANQLKLQFRAVAIRRGRQTLQYRQPFVRLRQGLCIRRPLRGLLAGPLPIGHCLGS